MDLKRSATIMEMFISIFTLFGIAVTAYVTITVTQARQDERIKGLERYYENIMVELKGLNKGQTEILLTLKDKQDREIIKK